MEVVFVLRTSSAKQKIGEQHRETATIRFCAIAVVVVVVVVVAVVAAVDCCSPIRDVLFFGYESFELWPPSINA
jgi:hypothetical protein